MVALGDSITAGTQDGITVADRQRWSYAQQLADQMGLAFNQPYLTEKGIPPRIWQDGTFDEKRYKEVLKRLTCAAIPLALWIKFFGVPRNARRMYKVKEMGKRDPATLDGPQHPQHNFAVAGYELRHLENVGHVRDLMAQMRQGSEALTGLAQEVPLIHSTLQNDTDDRRGSALDQAIAKNPDVVLFWAGSNDALETIGGVVDDRTLTPVLTQPWEYYEKNYITGRWGRKETEEPQPGFAETARRILERLKNETHAEIFVLNIPDVTVIPHLRPIGQPVGDLPFRVKTADGEDVTDLIERFVPPDGVKGKGKGGRKSFPPGSRVGLISIFEAITGRQNADGSAPRALRTRADVEQRLAELSAEGAAFTEWDVLDADEVAQVSSRIREFNAVLEQAASGPRFHLIDTNSLLYDIQRQGRELLGEGPPVRVTNTFTGSIERGMEGMFSYDGVHPSDTGHAMIANEILARMKRDLAGDPRFAFLRHVPPIDEKAVFRQDPHGAGVFILAAESVEALRQSLKVQ
jgi:lysophospholipase L1-like esterase